MLTQKLLSISLVSTEWVIYPLVLMSVASIAVIIERFLLISARAKGLPQLQRTISANLKKGDREHVENVLRSDASSAAAVAYAVLQNLKTTKLEVEECLNIILSEEKLNLERRLVLLASIGSTAPFIGLFGTVLGIIHAFHSLAVNVKGGPAVVMGGISEALVTTAAGLFVAIPAVIAYNYFVKRIRTVIVQSENFTRFVVSYYFTAKKG